MSREIKFRFWSGTKMFYDLPNVMECLKQQMAVWQGADPLKSYSTVAYDHEKEHGAKFLEWTGMKDKNGKEIYEGDVVKWDDRSDGKYWRIADVRWEEHQWSFYDHVSKHLFGIGNFMYADSTEEDLEIIGNIHENPELLK